MDFIKDFASPKKIECFRGIEINPESFIEHCTLADYYSSQQQWVPAVAEYRSSIALGNKDKWVLVALANAYLKIGRTELARKTCESLLNEKSEKRIEEAARQLLERTQARKVESIYKMNHNTFYRMKTLSDHLGAIFEASDISVLDIGGGEGLLSLFLPDAAYMLIEPTINGISALSLPFKNKRFDCVVACHVLEHIPIERRQVFLDSLCSLAKSHVILLNPFYDDNVNQREWQQMILDITGASWAKEHIDCVMPRVEEISEFATKRSYDYKIIPNGSKMMTIAMVLLGNYASQCANQDEIEKINEMFNKVMIDKLINEKWPNAYLVEIKLP